MHSAYRSTPLRALRDQQVRYAPKDKKVEQARRAEKLLTEIDPGRAYPYEYLCYRITDFRPESNPKLKVSGEDVRHDLLLFIEDVYASADVPVEAAGEPVLSMEELSRLFNVSSKTISRWREQGLVGRRFKVDKRKRVGFLQSTVDRFVTGNQARIERGKAFSQMSLNERNETIRRARELAQDGGRPAEVIRRLARETGRSPETLRYTLRQFDEQHPELALFPESTRPLTDEVKKKIYAQHRRGTSIEALAKTFSRPKPTIYRVLGEMRAKRLLEMPLDFMPNSEFGKKNADAVILGPMPQGDAPKKARLPAGLPPYLASLYEFPLLNREQERHLFRKLNYLKYKAIALRKELDPAHPKGGLMDQIERCYEEAVATKNQIIRANLRLVVSIAKRHVAMQENFFELVSDGNMSLIRAVEKFDYSRGFKFSTYASWAIMKNYARTIPDEYRRRERFRTSSDEASGAAADERSDQIELESAQNQRQIQVGKILEKLDEREQKIIISRFGLDHSHRPHTLKEVGAEMGVTKERIRQIESRALNKLREAVEEEKIEFSIWD